MNLFIISIFSLTFTISVYFFANKLHKRFPSPFTLPILIGTVFMIVVLLIFDIPYDTYFQGVQWIDHLLGPAVVALSYPLYKQWKLLKRNAFPIVGGVFVGSIVGVVSGLLLAKLFKIKASVIYSLIPKSVTTPVAMDVAESLGGISSLSAVFVMFAGIGGSIMHTFIYKISKIHDSLPRGIGIGAASHAIGISTVMGKSEEEGAAGTIAMGLSSIFVSIIAQPFVLWLM